MSEFSRPLLMGGHTKNQLRTFEILPAEIKRLGVYRKPRIEYSDRLFSYNVFSKPKVLTFKVHLEKMGRYDKKTDIFGGSIYYSTTKSFLDYMFEELKKVRYGNSVGRVRD